jgi:hypothetical protein
MNGIKHTFNNYSVNFYISGFYKYENNNDNILYNNNKEINLQNKIFNILQSKVSFPINSIINLNLSEIIHFLQKIDLCIANVGSGASFFYQTIFNKSAIALTTRKHSLDFTMQRYAFENKINKTIFINPIYITDIKTNFTLKTGFFADFVLRNIRETITRDV